MNPGVHALPNGQVIDEKDIPSDQLFVIGSLLKGILWESTAIPELRVLAANIATLLLSEKINFAISNGLEKKYSNS